jgi:hypothetical protein
MDDDKTEDKVVTWAKRNWLPILNVSMMAGFLIGTAIANKRWYDRDREIAVRLTEVGNSLLEACRDTVSD